MTDKQLTPMQEAIQIFKDAQKHIISNTEFAKGYDGAITDVITNLEKLLPKEKQVIEDAYDDGFENYRDASIGSDDDIIESQDYYNNKFKND